jgi:hypothetical protein
MSQHLKKNSLGECKSQACEFFIRNTRTTTHTVEEEEDEEKEECHR